MQNASRLSGFPLCDWRDRPGPPAGALDAAAIAAASGLPRPVARALASRGFASLAELEEFLSPSLSSLADPFALPGAAAAAERIWAAIRARKRIAVFGDFDADGVAAAAILVRALSALGADARPFLPERRSEGYGLTRAAIARCLSEIPKPALLITVDCGIASAGEVAYLKSLGVAAIVTDHHEPKGALPDAAAIVDPMLGGAPARLRPLCGAGVAFKLAQALVALGKAKGFYSGPPIAGGLIAPAAVATVADIVPLVGENRTLVSAALAGWSRFAGAGLAALFARAARSGRAPDEDAFAFLIAPRLNAAGRLESAALAYALLDARNPDAARRCAARLEELNASRKSIEQRIYAEALAQLPGAGADAARLPAIVVAAEAGWGLDALWHPGVVGIVASRLQEAYGVPAAVIALDGPDPATAGGRGSLRSCRGCDAVEALAAASETLDAYGGHAGAAGFSLKAGALARFRELFGAACAARRKTAASVRPALEVDCWVEPRELTLALCEAQRRMAPFGVGNPRPRWGVRGAEIRKAFPMGATGAHLSLLFARGQEALPRAVWFGRGDALEALRAAGRVDAVFELARNDYGGDSSAELRVVDLRAAEPS